MEGTYLPASDFYTGAGTKMISGAGTLSLSTRARARALFSLSLYRYPYNIPHPQFIVMSDFISVGLAIYRELACAPTENHIMLCLLSLSLLLPSLRPSVPPSLSQVRITRGPDLVSTRRTSAVFREQALVISLLALLVKKYKY